VRAQKVIGPEEESYGPVDVTDFTGVISQNSVETESS
jgi:hypothetical protein